MWSSWRAHFETNATRPLPAAPDGAVPAGWREALAASLARFQLGEAGEGRVAKEIDRVVMDGVDADYRVALKLFVFVKLLLLAVPTNEPVPCDVIIPPVASAPGPSTPLTNSWPSPLAPLKI